MKKLIELNEFFLSTMGKIDFINPLGMVLWARRPPGPGFILHIMLSEMCTGKKPSILVDDLLPSALFNRNIEEQNKINRTYIDFMAKQGCEITLSSQLFSPNAYFCSVVKMLHSITYHEFLRCLPERKRMPKQFVKLKTSEVLHIGAELMLFEEIIKMGVRTIIIPKFAQAIVAFHRNISAHPLSVIITPVFAPDNLEQKISSLKALMVES